MRIFPTYCYIPKKISLLFFVIILIITQNTYAQVISVDNSYTPQQLIENNLVQGCVEVSNISSQIFLIDITWILKKFSIIFYKIISNTYQKIGDLFCFVHISGLSHSV